MPDDTRYIDGVLTPGSSSQAFAADQIPNFRADAETGIEPEIRIAGDVERTVRCTPLGDAAAGGRGRDVVVE